MRVFGTVQAGFLELLAMQKAAIHRLFGSLEKFQKGRDWLNPSSIPERLQGRPVTFILPGSTGRSDDLLPLLRGLEVKAGDRMGAVYLVGHDGSVEDASEQLACHLDRVDLQGAPVNLVGHSAGGVAALLCALEEKQVKRVYTIASRLELLGDSWQDGPSWFWHDLEDPIHDLEEQWASERKFAFCAFHGDRDWMVPWEAGRLPGGPEPILISRASHLSILSFSKLHDLLSRRLWLPIP